jgi:Ca2+:H+ antiporter
MMGAGSGKPELARDTVFAAVMIAANGIVGLCLLAGGVRHHEQGFQVRGASAALAVLCALSVMTLVMPNHLVATPGPTLARSQLVFVGVMSLVLYLTFVFVQTVRHRDYFLVEGPASGDEHAHHPSNGAALASLGLLLVALVAVVGLAKALSPDIERAVAAAGAPLAVVGIVISMVVLLPESVAALRAARRNQLQNSLNLALGSALASIGLTIPTIAAVSIGFDKPIALGISAKDTVLLALTMIVSVITLGTGRTTVLQGMVHLTILAAYLFLAVVP